MRSGPSTAPRPSSTAASTAPGAREKMGRPVELAPGRSHAAAGPRGGRRARAPLQRDGRRAPRRDGAQHQDPRRRRPTARRSGAGHRAIPPGLGHTLPELWALLDDVAPLEKTAFSCCSAEGFTERLRGLRPSRVILTGIEAHVCVLLTALDLLGQGFAVSVVADAVSSRTPANLELGLAQARQGGAVVTATETVVFQLLGRADTDAFCEIAKLLK